ncbi:MAG: hypothetical protein IJ153_01230 [Clostridia bacterium]|nr:hypothetical protein [Clostridia bacterium]
MAYFQRNQQPEESYTRQFAPAPAQGEEWDEEEAYDDGFDELSEEDFPPEEIPEEELAAEKQRKYRMAAGFGDFGATIVGVVVILALVAFLINMIQFVSTDFSQNFSLWQTKF